VDAAVGAPALATIGHRVLARLVDFGLLAVLAVSLFLVYATIDFEHTRFSIPLWVTVVTSGTWAVYETVMIGWRGQTLGKMVLGIRVVRAADGARVGWSAAGIRVLLPVLANLLPLGVLTPAVALGVYLLAVVDPHRQGVHDKAAGTLVVTR
jgi:uncharacterized RDD family membrane protein YckC